MSQPQFAVVVHATHEAGFKVGGIGAVLEGLLAAEAYNAAVQRTILVGPMNVDNVAEMARLTEPRNRLTIFYSSWHQLNRPPAAFAEGWISITDSLRAIEALFNVRLLYGKRAFGGVEHEVLLVDARQAAPDEVNGFKYELWEHYRIASERYEMLEEYDLTVKAARPAWAALNLLVGEVGGPRFIIAHEWMGMPLALCAQLQSGEGWYLLFYAHEMATARILVEDHAGHDTRFYNALRLARAAGMTMDQVFGDRSDFFKHALIKQAAQLDAILAVGDWVVEELRFLGGGFERFPIDLAYNGIPAETLSLAEKLAAKAKLQRYAEQLLGYRPDFIFSHVTRLIPSKGLWRDLRVLEHLDPLLSAEGQRAVHFVLSTSAPAGRLPEDVLRWEEEYGWPVKHRSGNGDLLWHELPFYAAAESFNARAQAVTVILVNQLGWSADRCGRRMPADMSFADLRRGTDLEFGQSIYEPFGIAQVEPLTYGALCVVSNVCGNIGFVRQAAQNAGLAEFPNLIVADYVTLPPHLQVHDVWGALQITQAVRDELETLNSRSVADQIGAALPRTPEVMEQRLHAGQQVSRQMSWEVVARDYLNPVLARLCRE